MTTPTKVVSDIDLNKSRFDLNTYTGRASYFFATTNPLNCFATNAQLEHAKQIVTSVKSKKPIDSALSPSDIYAASDLYASAFHPDTGEKNFLPGRMSFQVWGNMTITGCMMTFYKSTPAVLFWQFANQSFNSVVNYTNRNASTSVSTNQLLSAYAAATTASVVTALGLNKLVATRPALSNGLVGRLVPLVAVAAANCINIPLMRQRELLEGIEVFSENKEVIGKSKVAASAAVAQVIPSRILMAAPAMVIPPVIMNFVEKNTSVLKKHPKVAAPFTVLLTGLCLVFSTPLCCALFPQTSTISVEDLELPLREKVRKNEEFVCYNKGL